MAISPSNTFKQLSKGKTKKHLQDGCNTTKVIFQQNKPNTIIFNNKDSVNTTCLRCENPVCLKFNDQELLLKNFPNFPLDSSLNVCPTNAISWPQDSNSPTINNALCLGCGLCISRCPAAAIYFNNHYAQVNDEENAFFIKNSNTSDDIKTINSANNIKSVANTSILRIESTDIFDCIYGKICSGNKILGGNFPNIFTRNILLSLGITPGVCRSGNTNARMDLVFESQDKTFNGVGDIEYANDTLDCPRNILDNIAVLHSRYNLKNILPAIFLLSFPNQRVEYWQVIKDIKLILKTEIISFSLGELLLLMWNRQHLSPGILNYFYMDSDGQNARLPLEKILKRKINIPDGFLGILETCK